MIDASGLDYNGVAAVSDLDTPPFARLLEQLERDQEEFLARESHFRSPEYRWSRRPLGEWSRAWEYPYVYHALKSWRQAMAADADPVVADVGSGVLFFPFSVAKLGCRVVCIDVDPVCRKDLLRAAEVVPHAPGKVDFRLSDGVQLPLDDGECDAVYCISVLEHIAQFERTVAEIARVLKPDGLSVITCDLDLRGGGHELGVAEHARLKAAIAAHFLPARPDRTVHPAEILTTASSPYGSYVPPRGPMHMAWRIATQKMIKPLFGRKPGNVRIRPLSVLGMTLRRNRKAA